MDKASCPLSTGLFSLPTLPNSLPTRKSDPTFSSFFSFLFQSPIFHTSSFDMFSLSSFLPAQKAQGAKRITPIVLKWERVLDTIVSLFVYHPYFELFLSFERKTQGEKISLDSHPSCQPLIQMLPHRRSEWMVTAVAKYLMSHSSTLFYFSFSLSLSVTNPYMSWLWPSLILLMVHVKLQRVKVERLLLQEKGSSTERWSLAIEEEEEEELVKEKDAVN